MNLPYRDVLVVELGGRIAAGACGRLLADLGASVHVIEPRTDPAPVGKWADRATAVAHKHSLLAAATDDADLETVAALIDRAEVVIRSSDFDPALPERWSAAVARCPIVCDITAFGASGPLSGKAADEQTLQALTGVMATTGLPEGPAMSVGVPVLEISAALYAASGIGIALKVLRSQGIGQSVDVALYDVGINALTTFMPAHCAGVQPRRLGNGHGMAVPWNAYPAADGWVLICSTSDAQWKRIAGLAGQKLAGDPRFAQLASRLEHRAEIDARLSVWPRRLTVQDLVAQLGEGGIPCGSIVTLDALEQEPNVVCRRSIRRVADGGARDATVRVPAPLIRFDFDPGDDGPVAVPPRDSSRAGLATLGARRRLPEAGADPCGPPLEGLRVIEVGQLTTAPLAARHLASFGADVIKIEPPEGESARAWAPLREGTSHFFVASNGEKRSLALDLKSPAGREQLLDLVRDADVLVENMKPGSLGRLGLGAQDLLALNPRLVYCGISGFGATSAYEGRPAVDTVIQAMSGMMDATRSDGVPVKAGISAADIAGGQTGLLAIVAALARRSRTGRGCVIDISMQDVGLWMTQGRWNGAPPSAPYDGPVSSVGQACEHAQTAARELIVIRPDAAGRRWEVFGSPIRLSRTPARIGTLIGAPVTGPLAWMPRL